MVRNKDKAKQMGRALHDELQAAKERTGADRVDLRYVDAPRDERFVAELVFTDPEAVANGGGSGDE